MSPTPAHLLAVGRQCGFNKKRGWPMEVANTADAANARSGPGAAPEVTAQADALCERDLLILEFERQWWKYAGAKEQAMREKFDMSATRYYQALNALIDRPE